MECFEPASIRDSMNARELVALRCDAALAALGWIYVAFAYLVVEYRLPYARVCPFALLSGLRCPLCGTTRFIGMCLHGIIDNGVSRNAGFLWFAFIVVLTVISTVRAAFAALGLVRRGGYGGEPKPNLQRGSSWQM